jgi:tellurite methyltransferase
MIRTITGFHTDDAGDWVAELSCLHGQHVRHRPPFFDRAWTQTPEGRESKLGADLDCPLCDRAELPEGLSLARTAGPFDESSLPAGLRRTHRVADATWGVLRVVEGVVGIAIDTDPGIERMVHAGERQPIPPAVPHLLTVEHPFVAAVDFYVAPHRAVNPG